MDPTDRFSAQHRDLLLELSLLIGERRGIDEIYGAFADQIRHGITFDFTSLFVVTADHRFIRAAGHFPFEAMAETKGTIYRADLMGADLIGRAPDGSEYIPRKLNLVSTKALAERGYERAWATPLLADGVNYGMLSVAKKEHGAFPPEHLAFLRSAAGLLAKAVRQDLELESARRNAARALAASELIFALQSHETFETIFQRLPGLLEDGLDVDYVGLVIDRGEGFVIGAETPAGVHAGNPPNAEGDAHIRKLAEHGNFLQFKPEGDAARQLIGAGYERGAISFLRDGDELRGMLMFARKSVRQFDQDERMFIELLRTILSQSLSNQHRLDRTEAAAGRARILNEVALLLNAGEGIDAIFQKLLGLMEQALDADYIGLLETTDDGAFLRMVGSRPVIMREADSLVSIAEVGVNELVEAGRLTFQYRFESLLDRTPFNRAMFEFGMRRAAIITIQQAGEIEGVLSVARKNEARFSQDDEAFLETLCAMLGQAIASRRRLLHAEADAARNKLLNALAILLTNGESPSAFFDSLREQLKRVVPFEALVLFVRTSETGKFEVVSSARREVMAAGELLDPGYFGEDIWQRVTAGETVIEGPLSEFGGELARRSERSGIVRGTLAPVQYSGETLGFFVLGRTADVPFSEPERAFVELVSTLVGQALANLRKVAEKEAEAMRSQVLSELAVLLQGGSHIPGHFSRLAELLLQGVGFDFISVTTRDLAGTGYENIRSHELRDDTGELLVFDPESIRVTARSGKAISHYETGPLERPVPRALHALGFTRAVSAVIVSPEGEEGLLTIGRREDTPFSASELGFIELVAALLGQASANYQKAYARDAETLRSRILSELALLLNNGEPLAAHFERLREVLLEGVGFDYCSIARRDAVPGGYRLMRSEPIFNEDGIEEPVNPSNIDSILQQGGFSVQYGTEAIGFGAPAGLFRAGIVRAASFVLAAGHGPEGLLSIGRRTSVQFTPEEMSFFEVVATLLGHAAANERRLAQTTAEAHEQALIAASAAAVARETGTLAIVRSLREAVARFIPMPFVNFGYLDDDHVSFPRKDGTWTSVVLGPRMTTALEAGQSTVPRPAERPGEDIDRLQLVGLERHILTRATSGGTTVGVLVIGSRDPEFEPSEAQLRLCQLIADIVGPAMANARAVQRERQEAEEQRVITAVASVAAREAEPGAMVEALQAPISEIVPRPFVAFAYRDGDEVSYHGAGGGVLRSPIDPYLEQTEANGQIFHDELPEDVPAESVMRRLGVHAVSATAVQSGGSTVGFLLIASREEGYVFTARERRAFRLIADIVGPAMENARAALRARQEADEQRVVAGVAAVAAREAEPGALVDALREPLAAIVPKPFVAFGYRDGEDVSYPRPDGTVARWSLNRYLLLADEQGQAFYLQAPTEFPGSDDLRALGVHAITVTAVKSAGVTVGFLHIGSRSPGYEFSVREMRTFRLIADIVGPAMENARATLRARFEAEEQRILAEAAAAVASARNESDLSAGMLGPIGMFVPESHVLLLHRAGPQVTVYGAEGSVPIGPHLASILAGEQHTGQRDDGSLLEGPRQLLAEQGIEGFAGTPITSEGETLGVLYVSTRVAGHEFSGRDLRLLRLIADFTGPAMANLRESARRKSEAEEQRILAEAAAAVAAAPNEAALMLGLRAPIRMFVPKGRVMLFYHEGDHMTVFGTGDRFEIGPSIGRCLAGEQVATHVEHPDILEHSRQLLHGGGARDFVMTPIVSGGETLGILYAAVPADDHAFSERDLRLLRLIAGFTGPAMANLRESARRAEEAEEQRILAEAAAGLAAGTTEADVIKRLVKPIRQLVPTVRIAFSYLEGEEMWLSDGGGRRPIEGNTRLALANGQLTGDIQETLVSLSSRKLILAAGVRHWADTVATSAGAPVGLLFVGTGQEDFRFSERVLRLLRLIADMAGPVMINARENARRRREAEDERVLADVAALAARASASNELIDTLHTALDSLVPNAFVLYGFIDGDYLTYQVTRPEIQGVLGGAELMLPLTAVGRSVRETGQAVGSLADVPADRAYAPLGLQEYALTGYTSAGAPLGVLLVSTTDPAFHFDERAQSLLRRIVQIVGPAVESSRAEAERSRQAELYSLMLRSLSEGVALFDFEGSVVFANELGRSILHAIDPGDVATTWMDVIELIPEGVREGYRAVYEDGIGSRGRASIDVMGKPTWFDYELVPLQDPVMRVLLVAADVTADVERELEQDRNREQIEQSQRLAALGELIGGVAHELNNPLTAILGFADVMAQSADAAPFTEELSILQKEALRARNIVRDLLFIVRPGTSERGAIPVPELIAHIERLRRTAWMQQGTEWQIDIEEPCMVWGNEHQLTQVLLNLITNAEYALATASEKRIAIHASMRDGETQISVTDTGEGMDEATRSRVFEPFFTTKQGHGTGLGLPLSYSIVQSHGGEIRIESKPNAGTTFTLLLPTSAGAPAAEAFANRPARKGTVRVLVVDDEASLRKVCQRLITSMGHECETAEGSADAIELARTTDFDLVLCDYRLASETADDVVAGFQRVAPQLIPRIVIATGATTDAGVVDLTERHGLRLMAKPYGIEELAAAIALAG